MNLRLRDRLAGDAMPRTATAPHHTTTPKPSQHAPQLATEPQAAPAAATQGPSAHVSATRDDKWHRWHLPGICGSLGPAANRRAGMCVCNLSLEVHHRLHPDFLLRTACSATDGPRDADTLTGEEMPLCRRIRALGAGVAVAPTTGRPPGVRR